MKSTIVQQRCRAALVALALDTLLPELPTPVHPVVMLGRWLNLGEQLAPRSDQARLAWGAAWHSAGLGLSAGAATLTPRSALIQGLIAHTLLAYRGLARAVAQVQSALAAGEIDEARRLLGWHLVSRPTADLVHDQIAAAAIESLAENLSDSVIAPLCWYLAGGLPALAAYRFANTADAMWGYHNARYEHLGKTAARCDDLLNLLPARLTAILIALAAEGTNGRGRAAWAIGRRDRRRTASPNAGWPMATMAGALDTTLIKVDHYQLGDGQRMPDEIMIDEARRITRRVMQLVACLLVLGSLPLPARSPGMHDRPYLDSQS